MSARALVREHGAACLLLLCCAGLYAPTMSRPTMFGWDEAEYASLARSIVRGEGFAISGRPNSLRPPLLPLTAAAGMRLRGASASDADVRRVMLIFAVLALAAVYGCTWAQYDRGTALLAAAVLGLSPWFWSATPLLMAEIPFMVSFTCAVVFLYFGLYRDQRFFPWSGLCAGLALLTRYTGLLFGPIAVLFIGVALAGRDRAVRARLRSRRFAAAVVCGAAVLAPWLARQQLAFGDALIGMKQSAVQLPVYAPTLYMPWDYYVRCLPGMLSWMVALFTLLGVVWIGRRRDRFALHCLLAASCIIVWLSCYRYKEPRLVSAALPFLAIVAALGLRQLIPERLTLGPAVLLATLMAWIYVDNSVTAGRLLRGVRVPGDPVLRQAAEFLRQHSAPDALVIAASVPQMHWYADRRVVDFPPRAVLKSLLERAQWVVITDFEPGQAAYARALPTSDAPGGTSPDVARFSDAHCTAVLLKASWLRERV